MGSKRDAMIDVHDHPLKSSNAVTPRPRSGRLVKYVSAGLESKTHPQSRDKQPLGLQRQRRLIGDL